LLINSKILYFNFFFKAMLLFFTLGNFINPSTFLSDYFFLQTQKGKYTT
jgi:hypothetical protein